MLVLGVGNDGVIFFCPRVFGFTAMQQIILGRCSLRNCQEVFLGHIHCSFYVLCKCVFGDTHHIYLLPMRVTGIESFFFNEDFDNWVVKNVQRFFLKEYGKTI